MRTYELVHLSDGTVGRNLDAVIGQERCATATVLAYIAEFDHRRLYLPAACSSMFNYCVERLHLSEAAAIKRIRAGRAARRFPQIFDAIASGRLHLSGVVVLAPFLKPDNVDDLLEAAGHKTKAEVEQLVAERFPKPDVPTRIRAIVSPVLAPAPIASVQRDETKLTPGSVSLSTSEQAHVDATGSEAPTLQVAPPAPRPVLKPLAPERFAIQFTIGQAAHDQLRYVQALLSHRLPSGDIAEVFSRALDALATQLEKEKFAATENPRPCAGSSADPRHIPAPVLRAVWKRDQGQCTFVSKSGQRCSERKFVEFDHVDPVARGGRATEALIRLRCRAHNQYDAECAFGVEFMRNKRDAARGASLSNGGTPHVASG